MKRKKRSRSFGRRHVALISVFMVPLVVSGASSAWIIAGLTMNEISGNEQKIVAYNYVAGQEDIETNRTYYTSVGRALYDAYNDGKGTVTIIIPNNVDLVVTLSSDYFCYDSDSDGSLDSYAIRSEDTLKIAIYNSSGSIWNDDNGTDDDGTSENSGDQRCETKNGENCWALDNSASGLPKPEEANTQLFIEENIRLFNFGTIYVSGQLSSGQGGGVAGHTSKANRKEQNINGNNVLVKGFSTIFMCKDSLIQNEAGSNLRVFGFIADYSSDDSSALKRSRLRSIDDLGNGSKIVANNGSKVLVPFTMRDFKGGSYMQAARSAGNISPFDSFELRNIEPLVQINYGAELDTRISFAQGTAGTLAGLLFHSYYRFGTDITFIGAGNDSFFQANNEYSTAEIRFDPEPNDAPTGSNNGRNFFRFTGNFVVNPISITYAIVTVSTKDAFLPISHFASIETKAAADGSGYFNANGQRIKFYPGSEIFIGSGTTVNLADTIVYGKYDDSNRTGISSIGTNKYGPAIFKNAGTVTISDGSKFAGTWISYGEGNLINASASNPAIAPEPTAVTGGGTDATFSAFRDVTYVLHEVDGEVYDSYLSNEGSYRMLAVDSLYAAGNPDYSYSCKAIYPDGNQYSSFENVFGGLVDYIPTDSNVIFSDFNNLSDTNFGSIQEQEIVLGPADSIDSLTITPVAKEDPGGGDGGDPDPGGCLLGSTIVVVKGKGNVRLDATRPNDEILTHDFDSGLDVYQPIAILFKGEERNYPILHLSFNDGSKLDIVIAHGIFCLDSRQFEIISPQNAVRYIGKRFVKRDDNGLLRDVVLSSYWCEHKLCYCYSPATSKSINCYANGLLTIPDDIDGLFNYFDVDIDTLAYDRPKRLEDIKKFGLFNFEKDFKGIISKEAFESFNVAYLKVAVGKGLITFDGLVNLANMFLGKGWGNV